MCTNVMTHTYTYARKYIHIHTHTHTLMTHTHKHGQKKNQNYHHLSHEGMRENLPIFFSPNNKPLLSHPPTFTRTLCLPSLIFLRETCTSPSPPSLKIFITCTRHEYFYRVSYMGKYWYFSCSSTADIGHLLLNYITIFITPLPSYITSYLGQNFTHFQNRDFLDCAWWIIL